MLVLSRQPFATPRSLGSGHGSTSPAAGLIVRVRLSIGPFCGGRSMPAEAFIDTGADATIVRKAWCETQRRRHGKGSLPPGPGGRLNWGLAIDFGRATLTLPPHRAYLGSASPGSDTVAMPGTEDVLIGRDFLVHHGLMLVVDGRARAHSLIHPHDRSNRRRVALIEDAVDPDFTP